MRKVYIVLHSGKHHGEKYSRGGKWGLQGGRGVYFNFSSGEASLKSHLSKNMNVVREWAMQVAVGKVHQQVQRPWGRSMPHPCSCCGWITGRVAGNYLIEIMGAIVKTLALTLG